ncbi:MAG: dienelactone hydrolase family protein, partial [Gammaproteobacteria bacterium]
MSHKDWGDPVEIERAWKAALVRIPNAEDKYIATTIDGLSDKKIKMIQGYPTVIYLHGCSGVTEGTYARINFLATNGYAVIAPISLARKKYPKSCDPAQKVAGLYRGTLKMRQHDAGYAIAKAKTLSWVDPNNVFLMGFSQGGITTATFRSKSKLASVNARVIEGWTCNAGWHEYKGIKAPKSEPVLSLVGANDPWFQSSWTRGDCSSSLNKRNGSKSIVYK